MQPRNTLKEWNLQPQIVFWLQIYAKKGGIHANEGHFSHAKYWELFLNIISFS